MNRPSPFINIIPWVFGLLVFLIGILNIILVHPVPGIIYIVLSSIYIPPVNSMISKKIGFTIPTIIKIILGIVIIMFTLGVSDLGDMMDKWMS
ncbi:MAG: hypothetical protein V4565_03840 [Bacteroidota bacterium]